MRGKDNAGEWPWLVRHGIDGHDAFYLRSFLIADFRPGRRPSPRYAITLEGKLPHPEQPLVCGTCHGRPRSEELTVVERATGQADFLRPFREGRLEWLRTETRSEACWLCNCQEAVPSNRVPMATIALSYGVQAEHRTVRVSVCDGCASHTDRGAAREAQRRARAGGA